MGKREEEASRKVLAGEKIEIRTSRSLLDLLLRPYRAYKQLQRERAIRKSLMSFIDDEENIDE